MFDPIILGVRSLHRNQRKRAHSDDDNRQTVATLPLGRTPAKGRPRAGPLPNSVRTPHLMTV
jgi:hypothetical protein